MAILWMDGFDTYLAKADVALRYPGSDTLNSALNATGSRFGTPCFYPQTAGLTVNFTHSASNPMVVGGTVLPFLNSAAPQLYLMNTTYSTANPELCLLFDTGGIVRLYRGSPSAGGVLIASSTQTYSETLWQHIEVKAVIADSGGTCEVRIGGTTVINFTGDTKVSTTGTAGLDRVIFGGSSSTRGAWDDIYILDNSGSVANNFLGDCRINTLAPTSDSSVQFTRSTGASNYLCVDEGKYNSDTDYVESSTVGHVDKYGFADLAAAVATVYGVQATCWVRKTDATVRTLRQNIYSNASTSAQTAFGVTVAYAPSGHVATLNPDGSVQWTPSTVNAALAGFEIVS